ncbi:carbamoyl-phosphate synthase (glutamine-hydrolyzing) large subunit [Alkalibacter rhizosphaerae]|uniref:Carbamoyl phosphate synthase large chain n=1 Tax=Alkalibacter rhizosphaerae TaxID=2815577 RepID=A0A974XLS6_9FIRM|nr:carbamoyl-phosphate synthase (glutamine-hydrolyzing) large subunit [Alkalibacter rhizosphaerae]QSX08296.1 carbamoyl-phosphate synthase (glutamine-hydrolyzing) large subunit [Alkalibacter rhizosphaerae]
MPKLDDIRKVLVIGSGPIVIGQAAEFDYAGTQACKALKEENVEVVLVNSNPATIMTDENMADRVYIQPLTLEALTTIIDSERPDGLLPTLGGQTGLNMAVELHEAGVLEKFGVRLLGTSLEAIQQAEDREAFRQLMMDINEPIPQSTIVSTVEAGVAFAEEAGYPVIVRPAYTMGGTGGGIAENRKDLEAILHKGLLFSRIGQALIEQSVAGWKEIEYEVMRDANDTCIIICNMENIDPVGIHTGDSMVVAPSQTLTDNEYHMLRSSALKIIKALKIEGGCNVQYALDPKSKDYIVIEVNPRVSRSSALASKAAGYPIAKVAAKIAIGLHLHEMENSVTKRTKAAFEPVLDYVVVKIPKWPFDKFAYANRTLSTQMKATGEVMAIDRSFESAFLKAVISLEGNLVSMRKETMEDWTDRQVEETLHQVDDERIFVIFEALRRGMSVEEIHQVTSIDPWFLSKFQNIVTMEKRLMEEDFDKELLREAERLGFTDLEIETLTGQPHQVIDAVRRAHGIYPVYKMVDTCAGEFESSTPYYYSTYDEEDENIISKKEKIIVIGSGPIRIGQGIEFDYCSVHAVWAIQDAGYESILINNNPETVSTDFDTADKLYFEPLFIEDVYNVIRKEMPKGVIVQFGGQTSINLAAKLMERGVQILGTSVEAIDAAEDRKRFDRLLMELDIPRPKGTGVASLVEALEAAEEIGYPVLVRPSYVIGGQAMQVVHDVEGLEEYIRQWDQVSPEHPILIDQYIQGTEMEVDAVSDGKDVLIPGIMEHVERTGVHSGDSFSVYPPQHCSKEVEEKLVDYTKRIARALEVIGVLNIQFVVQGDDVYIIEVNPRASRTIPIISKVTGIPMISIGVKVILGEKLIDMPYGVGLMAPRPLVAVKAPVFSFQKLLDVDSALTPEMKSTGEVLGLDVRYEMALAKAFVASGISLDLKGGVLFSLHSNDREEGLELAKRLAAWGHSIYATGETKVYFTMRGLKVIEVDKSGSEELESLLKSGEVDLVINTPTVGKDPKRVGFRLRSLCQSLETTCFTCLDTVAAYLIAVETWKKEKKRTYPPISDYR